MEQADEVGAGRGVLLRHPRPLAQDQHVHVSLIQGPGFRIQDNK